MPTIAEKIRDAAEAREVKRGESYWTFVRQCLTGKHEPEAVLKWLEANRFDLDEFQNDLERLEKRQQVFQEYATLPKLRDEIEKAKAVWAEVGVRYAEIQREYNQAEQAYIEKVQPIEVRMATIDARYRNELRSCPYDHLVEELQAVNAEIAPLHRHIEKLTVDLYHHKLTLEVDASQSQLPAMVKANQEQARQRIPQIEAQLAALRKELADLQAVQDRITAAMQSA